MPHFTRQLTNGAPIVNAVLRVTPARADALTAAGQTVPQQQSMVALIDTGASCTCVDPAIITALGLVATGVATIYTPSTGTQVHTTDQYDASIQIYSSLQQPPLEIPVIPVIASVLKQSQGIDALIGRDVLVYCLLSYNGQSGFYTLAF